MTTIEIAFSVLTLGGFAAFMVAVAYAQIVTSGDD